MRLRLGLIVGFGTGYYLGAKAGRERYQQLRRIVEQVDPMHKVQAVVELGRERLHHGLNDGALDSPLEAVVPPSPN